MLENLDKALADKINNLGDLSPEVVEKIVESHVEYYVADASVGVWMAVAGMIVGILVVIIGLLKDEYGGGTATALLGFLFSVGCFIWFGSSLVVLKAPEAYAVAKITTKVLDNE